MKCVKQYSGFLLMAIGLLSLLSQSSYATTAKGKPESATELSSGEVKPSPEEEMSCSLTAAHCNPGFTGHQAFFQLGISRVIFGTIDNSTSVPGQGDPVLHDFTCTKQATITAGVPQSITVNNNTHNQEDVKVYIDYNNDGDFTDAGELAFSSDKKISHTGSITAPLTATNNTVLRMRVLSDFFDNGVNSPCENIDFGQVEEYGVTVLVPVITSTSAGQVVNDNATVDPFSGVVLTIESNPNVTATITLDDNAKGTLSGTDLAGSGPYTIASKSLADMQAAIRALTFTPTANRNATTETTTFTLSINDGVTTSNDSKTTVISSAVAPTITAMNIPNTPMKVGDVVTATITVNSDTDDYTTGSGGISGTVGGFALGNLSRTNATTYTTTFTVSNGGTDVAAGSDIPVSFTLTDSGGKASSTFGTAISQASDAIDANRPDVNSITVADQALKAGETSLVTFTFSEVVTGFTNADITIPNGTMTDVSSADGGMTYTATFTPTTDLEDATNVFTVDKSGVSDNATNAGSGTTDSGNFTIDTQKPSLSITTSASDPVAGAFTATFTFSEDVSDFVVGDISVGNGGASNFNTTSASIYTATITPAADGAVTVDVAADKANDAAGNSNTAGNQLSVTNDETGPTVTITSTNTSGAALAEFPVTITFSEIVTGFVEGDITLSNATVKSGTFSGSGTTYTATISGSNHGTVTVDVAADKANDAAGNGNSAATQFSIENDVISPSLSITSNAANPQNGAFTATFTFDEDVTGFALEDIDVGNGEASDFNTTSAKVYTAIITPLADGNVTVDVAFLKATDIAGNFNNAATQLVVVNDETKPTVTITPSANPSSGAFTATFTFSEDVTGFVVGDISVGNGAASNFNTTSASVYSATITPAAEGVVTVDVAADKAQDAAGNTNSAATQLSVTNDETAPTVTITSTNTSGFALSEFPVTITFSESVTGFVEGDITLSNGTVKTGTFSGSGATYTATIEGTNHGTVTVDVAAEKAGDGAGNGNTAASQFSIQNDVISPNVSISDNLIFEMNGAFTATFTFDEDVTGFTIDDISVGNGAVSNFNATSARVYTATITPAADGTVTIDVPVLAATDIAGNFSNAAPQYSEINDETKPTLTITPDASQMHANNFTAATSFNVVIKFSEDVLPFDESNVNLTNGTLSNWTGFGTGDDTFTATFTPTAQGPWSISVAEDETFDFSNNGNVAASVSGTFDTVAPTLMMTSDGDPTNGPFTLTMTFSEPMTDFISLGDGGSSSTVTNANVSNEQVNNDGSVYTYTVTPINEGDVTITFSNFDAVDRAGTGIAANKTLTVGYDITAPAVSITTTSSDPTSGAFVATFTFSEDVSGFEVGDIAVGNGTASNFSATSATVYTATITPTADGSVTVDVAADKATDAAGNGNTAATQLSIANDETSPTVTITSTITSGAALGEFPVTFTFSETVTGFVEGDVTLSNGTVKSGTFSGSGTTYTATIEGVNQGTVTVDVAVDKASDLAGNGNTAATQFSIENDVISPNVTITSNAGDPQSGAFTATFTFDEDVTGFEVGDISVGNGAAGNFQTTSSKVYTARITPAADGQVTVDVPVLAATDIAGNLSNAAAQLVVTNDETAPAITITASADPTSGAFTATFTFSEDVTGFEVGDIAVSNGAASNFNSTSATVYTATITPSADGTVTVDVAGDKAVDAAGNGNTAATQLSVTNDETMPTVTITSSADPTSGAFTTTFTFSEDVTGFVIGDISVGNGVASNFNTTSASIYTATITPASDGVVTVDVAADKANDAAGNGNSAATQLSVTNDETVPTVTITSDAGDPQSGTFTATFTFSEDVTGFVVGDISVGNGAASNFSTTSASVYTATITRQQTEQ